MNLSILDEDFADTASMQVRIKELEEENAKLIRHIEWYDDMIFGQKKVDDYHTSTRNSRVGKVYDSLYGDMPICDTCDGRTGFFLEIDHICNAFDHCKWLIKIFRWLGYKPTYIEELHKNSSSG